MAQYVSNQQSVAVSQPQQFRNVWALYLVVYTGIFLTPDFSLTAESCFTAYSFRFLQWLGPLSPEAQAVNPRSVHSGSL